MSGPSPSRGVPCVDSDDTGVDPPGTGPALSTTTTTTIPATTGPVPTTSAAERAPAPVGIQVIGGRTVRYATTFRWMAALLLPGTNGFLNQFCGGTLVGQSWILTAAHCVRDGGVTTHPSGVQVALGRLTHRRGRGPLDPGRGVRVRR